MAKELKARGYAATSNFALNATGLDDPEWLEVVGNLEPPAVLVTYDNAMPREHGDWIRSLKITLGVIDSRNRGSNLTVEQYWRDVIHRYVHVMVVQEPGSWWKYRRAARRRIT